MTLTLTLTLQYSDIRLGWGNWVQQAFTPHILKCDEYRPFWVSNAMK